MSAWGRVRDRVLARTHQLGRQVALVLLDGLRRAVASDRPVVVVGRWPKIWAALQLEPPRSGKAARAALSMLVELGGGLVERLTSHYWRLTTHAADRLRAEQLDLVYGTDGPDAKGESSPGEGEPAPPTADDRPRTRACSPELERAFGRVPRDAAARLVAARVDELGAVERGEAWSVTITAGPAGDAQRAAEAFAAALASGGAGCWLVPELGLEGERLHHHGLAVGSEAQLRAAGAWGGPETCVRRIRDLRRLRYCAAYSTKGPVGDAIASGELAGRSEGDGIDEGAGAGGIRERRHGGNEPPPASDAGVPEPVAGGLGAPARRGDRGGARGTRTLRRLLAAARGWLTRRLKP